MRMPGRSICLILGILLFSGTIPAAALAGDGYADYLAVRLLEEQTLQSSSTRLMEVPGRGPTLFYAQTNPFWKNMRYEFSGSSAARRFGDSGCCPTSVAIAFANLLTVQDLGKIRPYAAPRASGFGFALSAVNPLNVRGDIGVFWLDCAEDYQRYLPLVFGQYAAGNNLKRYSWRSKPSTDGSSNTAGTGIGYVPELCSIYGLRYTYVPGKMNMDWIEPVRSGAIAIALANSQHHPFAAGKGHYVVIVGCDEEYLYIMDPQDKSNYELDRNGVLDVMDTGLVRVKLSDYQHLHIGNIHIISNAEADLRLVKTVPLIGVEKN